MISGYCKETAALLAEYAVIAACLDHGTCRIRRSAPRKNLSRLPKGLPAGGPSFASWASKVWERACLAPRSPLCLVLTLSFDDNNPVMQEIS